MKKILYLVLLLLPSLLPAQSKGADRLLFPTIQRRYYTQKNYQRLLTIDKDMARRRAFLDMNANLNPAPLAQDVTIPVVVHILYKGGTSTKTLPTESDVRQQLDIVSKDFRQTTKISKHEADEKEKFSEKNGLDTRISFCLASKDTTGKATSGVFFVPTYATNFLADDKMKSSNTGGSTPWNTDKFLNIWVVNFPDTISGYAQMPGGPPSTDGIVIDARYFGKKNTDDKKFPYTEGKTLTHLIGNYLNLYDLWSETVHCGDDGVDDTPIANAPTLGNVDYRHVSTCDGNPVVMSMNFMDNTNDAMLYMFTAGQKKRMQATIAKGGIRYNLALSGESLCGKDNLQQNLQALQTVNNTVQPTPTTTGVNYKIYPNPAQDNINLDLEVDKTGDAVLTIFNAQGVVLVNRNYQLNAGNQTFSLNCTTWATGIYFVHLQVNDDVVMQKFLIER